MSTFESKPLQESADGEKRRRRRLYLGVAYAYVVLLLGTNLATPLYSNYEQNFGFSPLVVTLIFSAYVVALIPSLLIAGPLSDAIGRRRVLVPAFGLALSGAACFALADGIAWLFAGRVIQGVSVGAASGALTASLVELEPEGDRARAAMVSATSLFAGIGAGPLLAGILAQYTSDPLAIPFLVEIAFLALALGALSRLPNLAGHALRRPSMPHVPTEIRSAFAGAGALAFLAGAVTGLFLTLVPSYALELSGSSSLAIAGGAAAVLFASSAVVQPFAYGRPVPVLRDGGLALIVVGFVLLILAGSSRSLALLLAATCLAGVGQGLAFLGAVTEVNRIAPDDRRADLLSSFYVVTYLGTGLPVIGAGILATAIGPVTAVQYFAGGAAVVAAAVLLAARRRPGSRRAGLLHGHG